MQPNHPQLLITTPTGNTGRYVLQVALAQGANVRVLVRDPARLDASARGRCDIVQGDLHDAQTLTRALEGVKSAFFCVPQSPDPTDIVAYYRSFVEPFAHAIRTAGVERVVTISGGDGQGPGFPGIGEALHMLEQTINATGVATRHLRCGYFMENFFWLAQPIARAGMFALPVAGDVPLPFVAAQDIGAAAARLLLDRTWAGQQGLAAHGPEMLTCDRAAQIASTVLDLPVRYQPVSGADYKASVAVHGVSEAMGQSLVDMFAAIAAGQDMAAPAAHQADCSTTLQVWMNGAFMQTIAHIRASATTQAD